MTDVLIIDGHTELHLPYQVTFPDDSFSVALAETAAAALPHLTPKSPDILIIEGRCTRCIGRQVPGPP